MLLPGRLSASTLGDFSLGMLHRERTTGRLELSEIVGPRGRSVPGRIHRVHLWTGLVAAVDTSLPVPRLGEVLRREGLVHPEALRRLLDLLDSGDPRRAGEILTGEGLASGDAVGAALRRQLRARVDVLFALAEASVAFRVARPIAFAHRLRPLDPSEFLHGRPRARDLRAGTGRTPPPPRVETDPCDPPRSRTRPVASDDPRDRAARLLGVPRDAAADEIRRAFRRLAAPLHPDAHATAPELEQQRRVARFAQLSAAYHLLVA